MQIPEPLKNCYDRTLRIVTRNGTASSFVMNYKEQQWLVTAGHVVQDRNEDIPFTVLDGNGGEHANLERLPRVSLADVAVLRLWTDEVDFGQPVGPYCADDVPAMQELRFLGFPKIGEPGSYDMTYASPATPFIKRASVSGEALYPNETDPHRAKAWLLDGMCSGGFSGGPVIIEESDDYRVFGVISCYVPMYADVIAARTADLRQAVAFAKTNMGLMAVFDIGYAKEAIDSYLSSQTPK